MKEFLLLSPEDTEKNKPTKILNSNLDKIKSFDAGFNFYFEVISHKTFHEALEEIFQLDYCFLILGKLTEYGQSFREVGKPGPRRKKKEEPTIQDRLGTEIVLDLDDHKLQGFDALKPVPAIKRWLKDRDIKCDVTWQITSSQKLNTECARIRLYFECSRPHELNYRKAWSQSPGIEADGSVYTCSQPIYTAPPIIEGGIDPIPQRYGFIQGETRTFRIPPISKEKVKEYNLVDSSHYDFDDPTLPEEVLSGAVYRRYFMPLAFHYANKLRGDREAIFAIISMKAQQVKGREFNAENVYAFIDDALRKIESEDNQKQSNLLSAEDIRKEEPDHPVPEFPIDVFDDWPDPWPLIWENFKKVPRQVEQPLLAPTMLSINAFFLRGNFVTAYHRRPNFFFLNLTPSTGNKDVNSKNVIRDLDIIFKNHGKLNNIFTGILNTESNITADSTFLQSFTDEDELFWINTEATRIFQQIKMSGSVSAVAALSDKLIEVVDGHEITGKIKASGKVKTIENPNAQVLFYAQPETIERYIDESMVDSGLFGRSLLSIVPELSFDVENYEMFKVIGGINAEIDHDFIDFYCSRQFDLSSLSASKSVLQPDQGARRLLNEWARRHVAPEMAKDDSLQKVLSRIGNSAEQLYAVVLGICQMYDSYCSADIRESIDIGPLLPLLEYWVDTKIYAIKHFVNTDLDPLAEAILEIIRNCLTGTYKMPSKWERTCIQRYNMVPKSIVMRILKNNTKLIRKLSADGDKKNAVTRADHIMRTFINSGTLKELELKIGTSTKTCVGIAR